MREKIKTAVIGVGHLGKEHARIYDSIENCILIAVCDINESAGREVAERFNVPYVKYFRDLIGKVDAVSVATPTIYHHEVTCAFLDAGCGVLVEKPISRTLSEADEMIKIAASKNAVLQVGHIERFNPAFRALKSEVNRPRFFEADRLGIFTPRSLDIDVVMDLMIHELDIISSLVKCDVVKVEAAGIPILTHKIDLANARIEFADGCVANITASRVSGERMRKLRVFQPDRYFSLDYAEQQVAVCTLLPPKNASAGFPTLPEIVADSLNVIRREPLLAEIESFLDVVRSKSEPEVSGEDGLRALGLAVQVLTKIKEHSERAGLGLKFD